MRNDPAVSSNGTSLRPGRNHGEGAFAGKLTGIGPGYTVADRAVARIQLRGVGRDRWSRLRRLPASLLVSGEVTANHAQSMRMVPERERTVDPPQAGLDLLMPDFDVRMANIAHQQLAEFGATLIQALRAGGFKALTTPLRFTAPEPATLTQKAYTSRPRSAAPSTSEQAQTPPRDSIRSARRRVRQLDPTRHDPPARADRSLGE